MTRTLFLAAAFAGALAAQPAAAGSIAVRIADLNLSSAAGQAVLHSRVHAAADRLCVVNGIRPLAEVAESDRCMREAIASTRAQMASRGASNQAASL